jgi:MFS family permease
MAFALSSGGIGAAFKSRNYSIYWWGNAPHSLGAWVYRLAVAWLTWELTQSTVWLGVVAFAHMVPVILFCPLAGATADRYGHKLQYLVGVALSSISVLVLAMFVQLQWMTIEILCVLSFVNGLGRTFTMPSRQALVVQLVEPKYMSSAIGVGSATFHGANFMGPALAGLIIAQGGIPAAFAYVALSGIVAITAVAFIKLAPRPARAPDAPGLFHDLAEGVRYTLRHPGIRLVILATVMMTLFVSPYMEMLAAVADRVLGMDAAGLSVLATAAGCGAMSAGLWIAWRGRTEGLTRILLGGAVCAALGLMVFAISTHLWLSIAALAITGFSLVSASACASSLIQVSVEPALRARVMSLEAMMHAGLPALGAVLIGWAGAHFGIQIPLATSAGLALLTWILLAPRVVRQMSAMEAGSMSPQPAQ